MGVERTESIAELANYYGMADVYVNPTHKDNFPTTNIEALACGTPVITYNTGGSPEAIDAKTGKIITKGDVKGLWHTIQDITLQPKKHYTKICRLRAKQLFNKEDRFKDYLKCYEELIK